MAFHKMAHEEAIREDRSLDRLVSIVIKFLLLGREFNNRRQEARFYRTLAAVGHRLEIRSLESLRKIGGRLPKAVEPDKSHDDCILCSLTRERH